MSTRLKQILRSEKSEVNQAHKNILRLLKKLVRKKLFRIFYSICFFFGHYKLH